MVHINMVFDVLLTKNLNSFLYKYIQQADVISLQKVLFCI